MKHVNFKFLSLWMALLFGGASGAAYAQTGTGSA